MMARVIQMKEDFNQSVSFKFDSQHRLEVAGSAHFVEPLNSDTIPTGSVEVLLSSGGRESASWKGTGQLVGTPTYGIAIDGGDVVDSLRSQVPKNPESSLARILHHPGDAEILARTIVSYAAPAPGVSSAVSFPAADVSGYVTTGKSSDIKVAGGVVSSKRGSRLFTSVDPLWFLPMFLVPLVFFLAFFLLGLRILTRRRRLEPFASVSAVK